MSGFQVEKLPLRITWVNTGIEYALKSWAITFNRLGKKNIYSRLNKIIVGVVAEQATIAALKKFKIDFDMKGSTDWYAVDRYDVGVNGKPIDIKAIFIDRDNKGQLRRLERLGVLDEVESNLKRFTALVPADQFNSASSKNRAGRDKIYVFPVVDAESATIGDGGRLCHLMWDYGWLKKGDAKESKALGKIELKSSKTGRVRLIGTSAKNKLLVEEVDLSKKFVETQGYFWQLFSVELLGTQPLDLTIKSKSCSLSEWIGAEIGFSIGPNEERPTQNDWMPVGIANGSVYICGFATDRTLRLRGRHYPKYSKDVVQYSDTLIDNWGVAVQHLTAFKNIGSV